MKILALKTTGFIMQRPCYTLEFPALAPLSVHHLAVEANLFLWENNALPVPKMFVTSSHGGINAPEFIEPVEVIPSPFQLDYALRTLSELDLVTYCDCCRYSRTLEYYRRPRC